MQHNIHKSTILKTLSQVYVPNPFREAGVEFVERANALLKHYQWNEQVRAIEWKIDINEYLECNKHPCYQSPKEIVDTYADLSTIVQKDNEKVIFFDMLRKLLWPFGLYWFLKIDSKDKVISADVKKILIDMSRHLLDFNIWKIQNLSIKEECWSYISLYMAIGEEHEALSYMKSLNLTTEQRNEIDFLVNMPNNMSLIHKVALEILDDDKIDSFNIQHRSLLWFLYFAYTRHWRANFSKIEFWNNSIILSDKNWVITPYSFNYLEQCWLII